MKTTTIDFNIDMVGVDGKKTFKTQDGKEQSWGTLATQFATILGGKKEGKSLKIYGWYKALQIGEKLMLDSEDKKLLQKIIEEDKDMFLFFQGQLLEVIENAK